MSLKFIFDRLFSLEAFGLGYPPHRRESQQQSRHTLEDISATTHRSFAEILSSLDDSVVQPVLRYPGVQELIDVDSVTDPHVKQVLAGRVSAVAEGR